VSALGSLFSNLATTGFPSVFYDIYTGILAVLFLAALFVYIRRRPLSKGFIPRRHLLRNVSQNVMWITGVGLFFALMRYVELTFVDMRFYSYFVILLAISYVGYLVFFLSERYPLLSWQFQQLEMNRKYKRDSQRRSSTASGQTQTGRSAIQRGKRRR
jgi:hypothetical protein